jgi:hypothetical protein
LIFTATAVNRAQSTEPQGPVIGQIVAVDENRGEVSVTDGNETIALRIKIPRAKASSAGGDFTFAKLPPGEWVSFYFTSEEQSVNKQKITIRTIVGLRLLGRDAYALLRERLKADASVKVERSKTEPLPPASPVKLYLDFEPGRQRSDLMKWVEIWNKKHAPRHVAVVVVDEPAEAHVALVAYRIDPVKADPKIPSLVDAHGLPVYLSEDFGSFLDRQPTYAVFLAIPGTEKVTVLSYRFVKAMAGWFLSSITTELEQRLRTMTPAVKS